MTCKHLSVLLIAALLATSLAGCTGDGAGPSSGSRNRLNKRGYDEQLQHDPDLAPESILDRPVRPQSIKVDWNGDEEGYGEPPEDFSSKDEEQHLGTIPDRSDVDNDDAYVYDELDLEERDPFD